ncbi:MAG: hypothetical protein ACRD5B_18475 [Nitrososphaeraceae archaeon]
MAQYCISRYLLLQIKKIQHKCAADLYLKQFNATSTPTAIGKEAIVLETMLGQDASTGEKLSA